MMSSTNSINRISITPSRPLSTLKSAKSEILIHGKLQLPSSKQKVAATDTVHRVPTKVKCDSDLLLDKCLVKGQELLRKAEEFNDADRVHDKAKIVASDVKKRDYIAKHQPTASTKASSIVSMNTKSSSANVNSIKKANETSANAITNHCVNVDSKTGNQQRIESENISSSVSQSSSQRTAQTVLVEVLPPTPSTLESCEIIPGVLDYSSDDSGHISNENEDLTMKLKPQKISEELLEIFEKKVAQEKVLPLKAKVIELNHINNIKTSLEIYPKLNKTCKSEVTFFINRY